MFIILLFFLTIPPPPKSTLFPYTTLFRSEKQDTRLYCDSAYYNLVHHTIRAYGNIHLNKQNTLNMFCDSLFFDTKKDYAKMYGNVRVRNNEYKLTTDSLDYDFKKNVGIYKNKGLITSISSSDQLSSVV